MLNTYIHTDDTEDTRTLLSDYTLYIFNCIYKHCLVLTVLVYTLYSDQCTVLTVQFTVLTKHETNETTMQSTIPRTATIFTNRCTVQNLSAAQYTDAFPHALACQIQSEGSKRAEKGAGDVIKEKGCHQKV